MLKLNATTTALVVIDLQEGILPFAGGPYTANEVVARAARLAEKCRANGSPVVMVRVGWSDDYAEALKQPVDAATPVGRVLRHRPGITTSPPGYRHHHIVRDLNQYRRRIHSAQRLGVGI